MNKPGTENLAWLLIGGVTSFVTMTAILEPAGLGAWLPRWQTLTTGLIAAGAAFGTLHYLARQIEEDRARSHEARKPNRLLVDRVTNELHHSAIWLLFHAKEKPRTTTAPSLEEIAGDLEQIRASADYARL